MLLTTCPNCSAQFKVQPEQLNVRQGRVMCGRCRDVFNAFQSLERVEETEELAAGSAPLTVPPSSPSPSSPPAALPPAAQTPKAQPPISDALFLRVEPPPLLHGFAATPVPAKAIQSESAPALPADFSALGPVEDLDDDMTAAANFPVAAHAVTSPVALGPVPVSANNRLLAGANPAEQPAPRAGLWISGTVLLALVLAMQATYVYRSSIAQALPEARGALVMACEVVGCTVPWGRDESAIRIEASDLIETPGKAGRIQLTATLANRSKLHQDFPALELKLTDSANQILLSRVIGPGEYLGRPPGRDEALAANAELFINLGIELTNSKVPASGYGVRAFYP